MQWHLHEKKINRPFMAMTKISEAENIYWKRNVFVASIGAFTTIVGMTLLLPFLPLYVEALGVKGQGAIAWWSGLAYGATFFSAAFVAPLWGRLGDRYGRKLMLMRASLGMAFAISLMGMVGNIWQLLALRFLTGLAGGYASGASVLAATQAPKDKTGWALGIVSTGIMGGNFIGPLIGGILPTYIGIRQSFLLVGGVVFLTFLATTFLMHENTRAFKERRNEIKYTVLWRKIPDKIPVVLMLFSGSLLMFAMMSIEPIITLYIQTLTTVATNIIFWAGVVMSLTALGGALSTGYLGRLADKVGHWKLVCLLLLLCALLLIPQAFVNAPWQLALLRFIMGLALGGILPAITAVLRHSVPEKFAGVILGFSVSAMYVGQVAGPLAGGFITKQAGMRAVFFMTALVMAFAAGINFFFLKRQEKKDKVTFLP